MEIIPQKHEESAYLFCAVPREHHPLPKAGLAMKAQAELEDQLTHSCGTELAPGPWGLYAGEVGGEGSFLSGAAAQCSGPVLTTRWSPAAAPSHPASVPGGRGLLQLT